jgi:hypothetical protein
MAMVPFYTRFRNLAFQETRSATIRGMPGLPCGEYAFLELYCDDPACDCRRVVINVITPTSGQKSLATINYGWESLEFYAKWLSNAESAREAHGATLDPLNPQSEYAGVLLRLFTQLLQDPAYVERLKRHYQLFKADLSKTPKPAIQSKKRSKRKR